MENKKQLYFTLDNLDKIGFKADYEDQDFIIWLQSLQKDGVKFNSDLYDDLCKNTINNGHSLLTSKNIFLIDGGVIGPIAKIIGQYLFRLLLGTKEFHNYLHLARKQKKELEIILEFDPANETSRKIMNLPWELMYCPERLSEEEEENDEGFFVSQSVSIYRKYKKKEPSKNIAAPVTSQPAPVEKKYRRPEEKKMEVDHSMYVSVAFLTKDIDTLKEVYEEMDSLAKSISKDNSNLHFEFINGYTQDQKAINLLSLEDLDRVFLNANENKIATPINKIVHLICDISIAQDRKDEAGKPIYESGLYFNQTGNATEPISLNKVFTEQLNKNLQDSSLKLLVLQAFNEEDKNRAYSGFEEIANRIIKKNQSAILSMPYAINQKGVDGKSAFFKTLYQSLADSLSILAVTQKLRKAIVPKFSYGFPLLYLNDQDTILVSTKLSSTHQDDQNEAKIQQRLKELKEREEVLEKQKHFFKESRITAVDPSIQFKLDQDIEKIDEELKGISEDKKKYSTLSLRLGQSIFNK